MQQTALVAAAIGSLHCLMYIHENANTWSNANEYYNYEKIYLYDHIIVNTQCLQYVHSMGLLLDPNYIITALSIMQHASTEYMILNNFLISIP